MAEREDAGGGSAGYAGSASAGMPIEVGTERSLRPLHPRVAINSLSSFNWTFDQELALSAELGVHWMGLLGFKLGDDPAVAFERMRRSGIAVSTVIASGFDLRSPETWDTTRVQLNALMDAVAAFGGWSVYITPGRTTGAPWADVLKTFADAVSPCVTHARNAGVRLAFEPSLRTDVSFVHTLRDAADVCECTGLGMVVDFGNCWMERDFRQVLQRTAAHIALIQVSDSVISRAGISTTGDGPGRVPFFEGELPIKRMMQDVKDAGYLGPIELELPGPLAEAEGYEAVIRRGARALSDVLYDLAF